MSVPYRVMYRLGFTPWHHSDPPPALVDLVEGPEALPSGAVLDVGCGTGGDLIYAARHGWKSTGVDVVPRALTQAQANADSARVDITLIAADISTIDQGDLGGPYSLVLDGGCLHGLPAPQLEEACSRITEATDPGAILLMFAFSPARRRGLLPQGLGPADAARHFPQWDLVFARPATDVVLNGPARKANPQWLQLRKR